MRGMLGCCESASREALGRVKDLWYCLLRRECVEQARSSLRQRKARWVQVLLATLTCIHRFTSAYACSHKQDDFIFSCPCVFPTVGNPFPNPNQFLKL